MANEVDNKATKRETRQTTVAKAKVAEHEYLVEDLKKHCEEITGYKKEVADGALFDCEDEKMTKKEFVSRINKFLKKEAK